MLKHGDKWFCWVCRKLMTIYRKRMPAGVGVNTPGEWSTLYSINGVYRDCHEDCYDEYSEGMPSMRALQQNVKTL